jgi:hypothetical protein
MKKRPRKYLTGTQYILLTPFTPSGGDQESVPEGFYGRETALWAIMVGASRVIIPSSKPVEGTPPGVGSSIVTSGPL